MYTSGKNISERCGEFRGVHLIVSAGIFPEQLFRLIHGTSWCLTSLASNAASTCATLHSRTATVVRKIKTAELCVFTTVATGN